MKQKLDQLSEKIAKLETETTLIETLDNRLDKRLKLIQREPILIELAFYLNLLELNAKKRFTEELFIQATPLEHPIMIVNSYQKFRLTLETLEKIILNIDSMIIRKLEINPYKDLRLTSYLEFKERGDKLLKMIKEGKLDDHLQFSASEILFKVMGNEGELLKRLGIDASNSYSRNRINKIISDRMYFYNRLYTASGSKPESNNENTTHESMNEENPVPPFLRKSSD